VIAYSDSVLLYGKRPAILAFVAGRCNQPLSQNNASIIS
jgi:hypothetical protein